MPPAPVRPNPLPYHFHTYDYPGSAPFQASPAQPTAGNLQFYSMVQDLNGLLAVGQARNIPNIALANVGGQTARHRRTMMLSFGNQGNVPGQPTVVITGGIHAREWIAAEIAYLIAEYLIVNYPAPGTPLPLTLHQAQLQNLVDTRNIYIMPMVNPDGNRRTVFGNGANDRLWRKNRRRLPRLGQTWIAQLAPGGVPTPPFQNVRYWTQPISAWAQYQVPDYNPPLIPPGAANYQNHRLTNFDIGVDLNRNMPTTAWGYDNPAPNSVRWKPTGDQFFGTGPGSEPETGNVQQAMVTAAAGANIDVTIDYHSYGRMILYPGETAHAGPIAAVHQSTGQMLNTLIRNQAGAGIYTLGTPVAVAGYDATGTIADYASQQHAAKSFTIELEPGRLNPNGFRLPEGDIQDAFEKNIRGALAAIAAPTTALEATNYAIWYAWNVWGQGNQLP